MLEQFAQAESVWDGVLAFVNYLFVGGPVVMLPLVVAGIVLWAALGYRWALLRRGSRKNVRVLIRRAQEGRSNPPNGIVDEAIARGIAIVRAPRPHLRRFLDEAFADYQRDLKRLTTLVNVLVAVAPLMGLLGTVIGMIETFNSLGDMTFYSQSGGIAAGIATALFTTQLGLVVAVPGVIAKSLLDRRQFQIENDLAAIKDILLSGGSEQPA
ncbi:MAG: MotA/TolQ/ExbB proton channel family protein [Pseudomonadota bacterium]|jgi:biopolymer transport protein ExbB